MLAIRVLLSLSLGQLTRAGEEPILLWHCSITRLFCDCDYLLDCCRGKESIDGAEREFTNVHRENGRRVTPGAR